jgi:hypothetical protein
MKCTALLACEKVIIDKDGAHSLINVMQSAAVTLQQQEPNKPPEPIPMQSNAVMPTTWWIYAVWKPSTDDVDRSFEQVYQLYWPSGEKFVETRLPFVQKDDKMQQTSFYFLGFPVGQVGDLKIISWLDSQGQRVTEIMETAVRVEHGNNPERRSETYLATL